MNKNLLSALRKCHHNQGHEWYGYLRPQEILELRDLGVGYNEESGFVDIAIERKKKGICNGLWFYFQANGEFEELRNGIRKDNN